MTNGTTFTTRTDTSGSVAWNWNPPTFTPSVEYRLWPEDTAMPTRYPKRGKNKPRPTRIKPHKRKKGLK